MAAAAREQRTIEQAAGAVMQHIPRLSSKRRITLHGAMRMRASRDLDGIEDFRAWEQDVQLHVLPLSECVQKLVLHIFPRVLVGRLRRHRARERARTSPRRGEPGARRPKSS